MIPQTRYSKDHKADITRCDWEDQDTGDKCTDGKLRFKDEICVPKEWCEKYNMDEEDGKCVCTGEWMAKDDSKMWPAYGLPDWTKTLSEEFLGLCTRKSKCGIDCVQCVESLTNKDQKLCVKCLDGTTLKNGQCYATSDITDDKDYCMSVLNNMPCKKCA